MSQFIYKFFSSELVSGDDEARLRRALVGIPGIQQVEVNLSRRLFRIIADQAIGPEVIHQCLTGQGFTLQALSAPAGDKPAIAFPPKQTLTVGIDGLTCHSCEITIERAWGRLEQVEGVLVNASRGFARLTVRGAAPKLQALQEALGDNPYRVREYHRKTEERNKGGALGSGARLRPSLLELLGLFALVLFLGMVASRFGLFKGAYTFGPVMTFGTVFLVGLVAASSSCIAVTGGLLLSSAAKFNERYRSTGRFGRLRPVALFIAGRLVGYATLGGLLGLVGAVLSPSPAVTGVIVIVAALYMFVMGLEMLHLSPPWLARFLPRLPKRLAHRLIDIEGKEHPAVPFLLGSATFFIPCGFTQALQIYALTTGSFGQSTLLMLAFALGTAPALLVLGWASTSLTGKVGRFFFKFSGALVVVLGLWNLQNGLTILGVPVQLPGGGGNLTSAVALADPDVKREGGFQVARMKVAGARYSPEHFTVKAGVPVRWEVDGGVAAGCTAVLTARQLGINKLLERGKNVFEFTPERPGEIAFNCSMGMVRGSFTVVP